MIAGEYSVRWKCQWHAVKVVVLVVGHGEQRCGYVMIEKRFVANIVCTQSLLLRESGQKWQWHCASERPLIVDVFRRSRRIQRTCLKEFCLELMNEKKYKY